MTVTVEEVIIDWERADRIRSDPGAFHQCREQVIAGQVIGALLSTVSIGRFYAPCTASNWACLSG
jgi:hypothetical protein